MRILHASARADTGGGPEMIRTLVEGTLTDAEHWVVCPAEGSYYEHFQRILGPSRVIRSFSRIRQIRPDVLHTHGFGAGLMGRLAVLGSGIPVVHTFHGFYPRGAGIVGGSARLATELLLSPAVRTAVAVSESEKSLVNRMYPPLARKTVVIPNGVQAGQVARSNERNPLKLRVLIVGRLVYQKYPELVTQIAAQCRRLDPRLEFEFRLAGAGPLKEKVLEEAGRLGVGERITLLGDVADIAPEFAQAHVYVSTARWEGLSLALLEAMHAGLPCVASRVQGNVDAIRDGQTGLLYDMACPEQAAMHLVNLARDPSTRNTLGHQARLMAQARFSSASMCRQYLDLYRHLLEPHRVSPESTAMEHSQS